METGVVQHIFNFQRATDGSSWITTFTQEWPALGQKHQLSYTIPVEKHTNDGIRRSGLSDVAINCRYQSVGGDRYWLAPRISLLLNTGDEKKGFGAGAPGLQIGIPLSAHISSRLVSHSSFGLIYTPGARNSNGEKASTTGWNIGQSLVWLAHHRFNVMLEGILTSVEEVNGRSKTKRRNETFISPGIRWSYDFPSGLQIVPGLAFPFGVGASYGEKSAYLYLSFEHPY